MNGGENYKNKIIPIVRIVGITLDEILVDIEIEWITIHSVEWRRSDNKVYVHTFLEDDYDIEMDFEDLPIEDQKLIYTTLAQYTLN